MKSYIPTKYHLYLIKFMEAKAGRLAEFLEKYGYKKEDYFNNKDRATILKWEDWKVKEMWEDICDVIREQEASGIEAALCPFCVYYNTCGCCKYGAEHDYCKNLGGAITILENICQVDSEEWFDVIFNNRWYRKIIEEIEKE